MPLQRTRELYDVAFSVLAADLADQEDVRVLAFSGHHIFANFRLSELGESIKLGD